MFSYPSRVICSVRLATVAAKSQVGIGVQVQPDMDSFFYLVVIELLTSVICV